METFNPILPGGGGEGGIRPPRAFLPPSWNASVIKLELSDFKDTSLRYILQVIPVRYILRCYHGNKIAKGTLQNLAQ